MNVNAVSLKGRRDSNEDKHSIILNEDGRDNNYISANYYAVYDGHGGKYVSNFLSEYMPRLLMKKDVKYPLSKQFILEMYKKTQDELKNNHKKNATHCGSTCLIIIHYKSPKDGRYYFDLMNTGDSRAIICRDNLANGICKDHKPNWPEEKHRIQKLGGHIYFDGEDYRIKDLSVSRAIGDIGAEPYVTYTPDIYRYRIEKKDKFIVMACDGLWYKLSNQEVANFILIECYDSTTSLRINKEINIAKKLGEYAIQRRSTDNITIIIIFFD